MKNDLIEFCRELIRAESLSGHEQKAAALVAAEMKKLGYDEVRVDEYGSVVGKISGGGKKSLLFDGHMDTVGVPSLDQWSVDPFSGEIRDGRLYGRGSADMKSALAAMIHGAAGLIKEKERLHGDIYVCAVVFEETLEGVALGKILDTLSPDWVIIGEPSDMKLALGQKGRAEIVIETKGRNAHSATPHKGINAIDAMHRLVSRLREIPLYSSPKLGKGILEITDIVSSPYPGSSVVPDYCRATYDRRLIEGESEASVLAPFQSAIEELRSRESDFEASVSVEHARETAYTGAVIEATRFFPGWIIDEESPLARAAAEGFRRLGADPETCCYPFCTDGSESAGKRNIPTIGLGPASPEMAHVVDENVGIDDIIKAANLYREIARSLLE